jgi:ABC-type multidrug transport system fused ATPase/permease subunit
MSFVSGFADRICCLESGRFVDVGTPEELSARPGLFQQLLKAPEKRRPPGEPPPDRPVTGAP